MKDSNSRGAILRLRILVVDDDEDVALSVRDVLELRRHDVRVACSLEVALHEIERQSPDVLVTDFYVGDESSDELIARTRRHQPKVRCVLISGSDPGRWNHLVEGGLVHGVLRKPFVFSNLVTLVEGGGHDHE